MACIVQAVAQVQYVIPTSVQTGWGIPSPVPAFQYCAGGGVLEFVMSASPNKNRGQALAAKPYSLMGK